MSDGSPSMNSTSTSLLGVIQRSASFSVPSATAICSKDSVSMKCASLPSAYRNCILRASVCTGRNFSPALNVRAITLPSEVRRSFVRTNAPPLPGLTCWNSRILKIVPSTSMWLPFLNWLVLIMGVSGRYTVVDAPPQRSSRLPSAPMASYMRRVLRQNALCTLLALGASFAMGWLALVGFAWTDYEVEAMPAYTALLHGHIVAFLRLAPAYGGSLLERAPFALAPELWGGGANAVYRMAAVPCLLAAAVLGVFLAHRMRAAGHSKLARAVAVGVCVANP